MKKFCILMSLLFLSSLTVLADYDDRFYNAFKKCIPYTSNGVIDAKGVSADFNSQIMGWDNDKCVYVKKVSFSGIDACVRCRFSRYDVAKLTNLMKTHANSFDSSGTDFDISDIEALKSNPVLKTWSEYFEDPSVCSVELEGIN